MFLVIQKLFFKATRSSNVYSLEYDKIKKQLTVAYLRLSKSHDSGLRYKTYNVPISVYDNTLKAERSNESVGKSLARNLALHGYPKG